MKNLFKGKAASIVIILATLVLAGIAIFTAVRLYQLRNQSVSPNAPQSQPKAAGTTCGGIQGIQCPEGETCVFSGGGTNRFPSADMTGICEVSQQKTGQLCGGIAGTSCPAKYVCVYSDGTQRAPSPDASGTCQLDTSRTGFKISCTLSFTLVVATPTPTATPSSSPTASPTVSPTASPTVSPTASPTPTGTPNPSETPNGCNGTCGSNFNCQASFVCYNGFCRNPSCTQSTSCTCAGTPIPVPPTLPNSGVDWPTVVGAGVGIFTIIGSLLLAL